MKLFIFNRKKLLYVLDLGCGREVLKGGRFPFLGNVRGEAYLASLEAGLAHETLQSIIHA